MLKFKIKTTSTNFMKKLGTHLMDKELKFIILMHYSECKLYFNLALNSIERLNHLETKLL